MSSPTQRTLKHLRDAGFISQVVERFCPYSKRRIDLFGFIDIVAVGNGLVIGVQATSGTNHSARRTKILALTEAKRWLEAGAQIWICSWSKRSIVRGGRGLWTPRMENLTLDSFKGT